MIYFSKQRTPLTAALALLICSLHGIASAADSPPMYTQDFRAGFQKGSDDARAHNEIAAKELDTTFNFSKYAINGQLPPSLRNTDKDAPFFYRCAMRSSTPTNFSVIASAQPLCKETNAAGVCTRTLTWRDFLMEDLAPVNPPSARPIEHEDHFKRGEDAAKETALDNMNILNSIYMGMGTYRTLESCSAPANKK